MYDSEGYLYANGLDRYAIGDRTKGLRRGRTARSPSISSTALRRQRRANWLPAPRGRFRLIMRLYEPSAPRSTAAGVPSREPAITLVWLPGHGL